MSPSVPLPVDLRVMSAQQVIAALELEYLEGEGCWISLLWRTPHANAIYALITPGDFSAMHRLQQDEAWTYIAGAPAQILQLDADGTHALVNLGTHVGVGEIPHHNIPAGSWQGTITTGEWTLVSCVLAPPFSDFELATEATDFSLWSDVQPQIIERMRVM